MYMCSTQLMQLYCMHTKLGQTLQNCFNVSVSIINHNNNNVSYFDECALQWFAFRVEAVFTEAVLVCSRHHFAVIL